MTDGESSVADDFLRSFHVNKQEKSFHVLSLTIGSNSNKKTVKQFSDKVVHIEGFTDEGSFKAFEI